jgi:thiol-disulfide isomerase/thioredoxin
MRSLASALPLLLLLAAGGCAAGSHPTAGPAGAQPVSAAKQEAKKEAGEDHPALVGHLTRQQIEETAPEWVEAEVAAQPEADAAHALAAVPPGAEVTVLLGTWCSDSRREVPRLWRALDEAGGPGGHIPFEISYIGVDRDKKEPAAEIAAAGLRYVPTLIVRRDGREVGRIVESAPHGVERDLLALLDGSAQGVVSGRDDLAGAAPQPH